MDDCCQNTINRHSHIVSQQNTGSKKFLIENSPYLVGIILGALITALLTSYNLPHHSFHDPSLYLKFKRSLDYLSAPQPSTFKDGEEIVLSANEFTEPSKDGASESHVTQLGSEFFVDEELRESFSQVRGLPRSQFGAMRPLHVTVLTGGSADLKVSDAVLAWWTNEKNVQYSIRRRTSSRYGHDGEVIELCNEQDIEAGYEWYALVAENTYLDSGRLLNSLRTLPDQHRPLFLGHRSEKTEKDSCSIEDGIVLSRFAIREVCQKVSRCRSTSSSDSTPGTLMRCLQDAATVPCTDFDQVLPSGFHLFYTNFNGLLASTTSIIARCPSSLSMDELHVKFLQRSISEARNKLRALRNQPAEASSHPDRARLSQERSEGQDSTKEEEEVCGDSLFSLQDGDRLVEGSETIFPRFVDERESFYVARTSCDKDLAAARSSSELMHGFRYGREIVEAAIGQNASTLKSFAQVTFLPESVREYDFYYYSSEEAEEEVGKSKAVGEEKDQHRKKKRKRFSRAEDKVYEARVVQTALDLEVDSREVTSLGDFHIVTTLEEGTREKILETFLMAVERACDVIRRSSMTCNLHVTSEISRGQLLDMVNVSGKLKELRDIGILSEVLYSTSSKDCRLTNDCVKGFEALPATSVIKQDQVYLFLPSNSLFDYTLILRCYLNTKSSQRVYFPIPFEILSSEEQEQLDWLHLFFNSGNSTNFAGFWGVDNYRTFCSRGAEVLQILALKTRLSRDVLRSFKVRELEIYRHADPALQLISGMER